MFNKSGLDPPLHHARPIRLHDDVACFICITDNSPHITWTDTHQFVILHVQPDKSLYIFTNDNSVTKIPFHVHSRKDFDFRDCLFEEHGVTTFDKPKRFARCLTVDDKDPDIGACTKYAKTHRSLQGEFYDKQFSIAHGVPVTIHRRALKDDSETNPARRFSFRNFDVPNKTFLDCWYHQSNNWKPFPVEMFMLHKTSRDIIVLKHDESFPPGGVMIRPPLAHQCGVNACLLDNSLSRFLYRCPSTFVLSSDPDNPVVQCPVKFRYLSISPSHLISSEDLDSLMTDVIISFARAWNTSQYRCRFEFDNKQSQFWKSRTLEDRLADVAEHPSHNVTSLYVFNQYRESSNFPLIKHLIPDTRVIDHGYHLVSTVITTNPSDVGHFDVSTIPQIEFCFVDDMDARDRGFTWYHKHFNYILYMNVKEPNLYAFGNLQINTFIDMKCIDGHLIRAWRRYEPVVRQHVITATQDLRPIIRQEHPDDAIRFTIPGTDVTVNPGEVYPFEHKYYQIEWTPVIIACDESCRPPKTLFQYCYNQAAAMAGTIKGVRRSITIRNDFFNNLIRHNTFAVCTRTLAHRWKISKYGPVSFLMCGSLLDDCNVLDFHKIVHEEDLTDLILTITFTTFSPTFGLCGFTHNMVNQFTDQHPVFEPSEHKLVPLPQWPCSPNCRTPATIAKLKILDDKAFRDWLSEMALNVFKLKYLHSETTSFKCSINQHAHWRVLTKGRFQIFFCNNFAMFGLNFRLPIYHPKRWIMSYCFTEEELSSLQWTKSGKFWTATITNAIVTRQRKQFPLYSVMWIPSGDSCVFHMGRLGMAQPILDSCHPHSLVYTNHFEADSASMGSILKKFKSDSITSNTIEAMALRVLQSNRALEYELLKLSLESSGVEDPNPSDVKWRQLTDKFATTLTLDTPELTQYDKVVKDGVDDGVDVVNTERNPLTDFTYLNFNLELQETFTPPSTQSSDSSL